MPELSPEEQIKILEAENRRLKEKFDDFKNLDEELAAKRIYDLAYERLKRLVTFGGILTLVVGIIGYKTLTEQIDNVVQSMDKKAVLNMAKTEIDIKVLPKFTTQIYSKTDSQVKKIIDSLQPFFRKSIEDHIHADSNQSIKRNTYSSDTVVHSTTQNLPIKIDLSNGTGPVRDGGQEGSVVGFSLSYALQYTIWKEKGESVLISPRFIYNSIKACPTADCGANLADGIRFLHTTGAVEESVWPYVAGQITALPPVAVKTAHHYKIRNFDKIPVSINSVKNTLAKGFPIIISLTVYQSFESANTAQTGIVPVPQPNETIVGGHSLLIVGYNDKTRRIKFKNNWGISWGDKGYGYLSYSVINENYIGDAWIIKNVY